MVPLHRPDPYGFEFSLRPVRVDTDVPWGAELPDLAPGVEPLPLEVAPQPAYTERVALARSSPSGAPVSRDEVSDYRREMKAMGLVPLV